MSFIFFICWLLITLGLSAWMLHAMGKVYGAHVATSFETRLVVLVANGGGIWLALSFVRWIFS